MIYRAMEDIPVTWHSGLESVVPWFASTAVWVVWKTEINMFEKIP